MHQRTSLIAILAIVLASLVLETEAAKRRSNQTDNCYKPCRVRSVPVCGSDGRNYTTGCHLSVARCRARRIGQLIYVVNTGYCRSSKPVSQCHLNCTERRAPVCASNKKTYKNLCQFKKAKCEARKRKEPLLTVVKRRGACVKERLTCRTFASCPKVKRPVCGSNNKTYMNMCHLKTTNCRLKRKAKGKKYKKLTLKYCGACGRGKQCVSAWSQKCPEVKFCDQMLRAAVRYAEIKKAAGSKSLKKDGKSKGKTKRVPRLPKRKSSSKPKNKNTKQRNKKKTTSTKRIKSKKPIPSKNLPKKPNSKSNKKTGKFSPKKMYQVCGSDGKTYPSVCHLQVEQCNKISRCQRLQMKHKGACKKRPGKT